MNLDKQSGFSLLEVLVAFSIFAVSLGILFQIYSKGAHSARLSDEYATAIVIAQSKLDAIGIETIPDIGVYEDSDERFRWITRVSSDNDDSDYLIERHKLVKSNIEVEVLWENKSKTRSVKLNTKKLLPVI